MIYIGLFPDGANRCSEDSASLLRSRAQEAGRAPWNWARQPGLSLSGYPAPKYFCLFNGHGNITWAQIEGYHKTWLISERRPEERPDDEVSRNR